MAFTLHLFPRHPARRVIPAPAPQGAPDRPGGGFLLPALVGSPNAASAATPPGNISRQRTPRPGGDLDHGILGQKWIDDQLALAARPRHRDTGVGEWP